MENIIVTGATIQKSCDKAILTVKIVNRQVIKIIMPIGIIQELKRDIKCYIDGLFEAATSLGIKIKENGKLKDTPLYHYHYCWFCR